MTAAEEINKIIFNSGTKETWLAEKLHISPQSLNYKLHGAKIFDKDLFGDIMKIFKEHGIINNVEDECSELTTQILNFSSHTNDFLSMLQKQVTGIIKDDEFDHDEKIRFRFQIKEIRKDLNTQLDELDKLAE